MKAKGKKKKSTGSQMLGKAVKTLNQSSFSKTMKGTPKLSQRDAYAQAMGKAQRNGGSNGVGVGY